VRLLERLDYREVVMHGRAAKRTVRHFGLDYDYQSRDTVPTDPLPAELEFVRERAAALAERELVQILISRYPAGAGIGWHRDAPMFGRIVGVSLGAPCRMRFQRRTKEGERLVEELELEPRSAYLLSGQARWTWQHSIPATKELRYSITFRTLREER
jgi:alkylated DNA repair protein (DNA oxidative demethylase)